MARMVARVARREIRGNSQLRVSLSAALELTGSDRQAQMDSGGLVVSWLSSCTTAWHNYRFDLCEFLRFFHIESFTGLDFLGSCVAYCSYLVIALLTLSSKAIRFPLVK